jgi:hypothetical protein
MLWPYENDIDLVRSRDSLIMNTRHILAIALLLTACQGDQNQPLRLRSPSVAGVIDLQLGEVDGPAPYMFGRVTGLAEDKRGRILVADFSANEIRVFNPAGDFLFSVGREGEGPGEMRGPCCLAVVADTLWVRDGGNGRYVGYRLVDDSAVVVHTLPMHHSDGFNSAPLAISSDGRYVDTGYQFTSTGTTVLTRFHTTADGEITRTVAIQEPPPEQLGTVVKQSNSSRFFFPQPFGPQFLTAYGPDGVYATAISSGLEVTVHDTDTVTWMLASDSGEGPLLSAAEQARADQRIADYVQRGRGARSEYPRVPIRKPPLADLMFDQEARLWVFLSVADGEPAHAQVYDLKGQLLGERTWPFEVDLGFPAWIEEDHALGIATDSLGVQRVVRLRFGR